MDLWFVWEILIKYYHFICNIPAFSNIAWEYLKDSKDVIIALLAVIFTIYIPFLLYFYQEINWKKNFKYLDLYIFHKNVFNLRKIFLAIIFLILILLFWNTSEYSNYYWINIIILITSIFPFWFFINNLFNLYELNENLREEKNSKHIIKVRLNSIKNLELNQENFYIFKDILQNKNLEDYHFTKDFFKIFFEKINSEINKHTKWDWRNEQLIRNLFFSYKKLKENSSILNSFQDQDFKLLLNIYKSDNENKYSYLSWDIMKTIISKMEKISWDTYLIIESLKTFLEKESDNFRFKFLSHIHSEILKSEILLEDREFMEKYWIDIFDKYKDIFSSKVREDWQTLVSWKLQNSIFIELIQTLWKKEGDYNYWYDNILKYWLLNFEPLLFTELLFLYFVWYGENKAFSILEAKRAFWLIGRLMTKTSEEQEKELHEKTIINFYETFKNNMPNFDELISQFKKLEKNEKLLERDILKSKDYMKLIKKLQEIKNNEK